MAEVLGSNVYTVDGEDSPPPPSDDTPEKSLSHSASSDTLKEVRVNSSPGQACVIVNVYIVASIRVEA